MTIGRAIAIVSMLSLQIVWALFVLVFSLRAVAALL